MIGPDGTGIDIVIRIRARPETVFRYLTDATSYRRWMGHDVELDPRPGGLYRVRIPGRPAVEGRYLVVVPPERVVFTWGWVGSAEVPPGSTTVEIDLTPEGDGTVLRLVHRGLPTAPARAQHTQGWDHYLDRLSKASIGVDPGPDTAGVETPPGSVEDLEERVRP
jgi:uncharacterized protein YndB with AHSA1/START domain